MRGFYRQTILLSAIGLAGASCQTTSVTDPCLYLVHIPTTAAVNRYLVDNAKPTAIGIARNNQRYIVYRCGESNVGDHKIASAAQATP